MGAVLAALNAALAGAHVADRFIPLAVDEQIAHVVFAPPAALNAAAPALGLTVSADPDNARKRGKVFERGVKEQLPR